MSSDLAQATPGNPVELRRVEGSGLGERPRKALKKGEAHSILTGGFVPAGADSVVQAERVKVSDGVVAFSSPVELGEFVYPRGRDVKKGERVLEGGQDNQGDRSGPLGLPPH